MKAKRRLTDIKFEKEGAHLAMVSKSQGGPANGVTTLVYKATNDITDEYLEKATMVKVTLPFDDFLEKFFRMWSEDADMLTEILGFSDEEDVTQADKAGMSWEDYQAECEKERQDFINSVEIMKSKKPVSELSAGDFLSVMTTQSLFESKLTEIEKAFNAAKAAQKENKKVEIEVELQKAKEAAAVAQAEVQKARDEAAKAVAELEVMKAAQVAAKDASRKQAIADVVPEDKVEDLFKSLNVLDDAAFTSVVDVLKNAAAAEAEVMKEKGVGGDKAVDAQDDDKVAAIFKAKYAADKQ